MFHRNRHHKNLLGMKFFFGIIFIFLFVYVVGVFGYIPIAKVVAQGPPPPPPPVPCEVTTNPSVQNINTGDTGVVSANVTSGLDLATVVQMTFGSYDTAIATVNPSSDLLSPYSTTVTAVAAGNTSVWATATLSDGRICQSTAVTDTDVSVTIPVFTISGTVINTKTGGVFQGIVVKLYQGATLISSTTTAVDGTYSFNNLLAGTYTVTITIPLDKKKTTSDSATVTVGPDRTVNFGMVSTYTISGIVYIDVCSPTSYDSSCDTKFPGAEIKLSGDETGTKITDVNGYYSFTNVGEVNYTVAVIMPAGYSSVTANSVNIVLSNNVTQNFGIILSSIITVGGACNNNTLDVIIVFDHSSSMGDPDPLAGVSKIAVARAAASAFVDIIAENLPTARIGVVQFSTSSDYPDNPETALIAPLTSLGTSINVDSLKNIISNIGLDEGTCHECGIDLANKELLAKTRGNAQKMVILLTDGRAHMTIASDGSDVEDTIAENATMAKVIDGVNTQNIIYNVIGVGSDSELNEPFLEQIANTNYGEYYNDPDYGELLKIFEDIASKFVPTGAISGFIFEDKDNMGDPGYGSYNPPIEGPISVPITVQLSSTMLSSPITTQTDINGNYSFKGLCTASYTVTAQPTPVWLLTTGISSYTQDVVSGEKYGPFNFGYKYGYTISGKIFNDVNKNKIFDDGIDEDYPGPVSIDRNPSRGAVTVNMDKSYIIQGLEEDTYTVSFASSLLSGFFMVYPDPAVFSGVKVGLACSVGTIIGASCSSGNVINLNFAVSNSIPWWQTYGLDVRMENSFDNPIPATADVACGGGPFASGTIAGTFDSPGIIFSGDGSAEFSPGFASDPNPLKKWNWTVGGGSYPELFESAKSLKTSTESLLDAAAKAGIVEKDPGNCSAGCNLPQQSGVYHTNLDMKLDKNVTFDGGSHIFVSDGTITFVGDRRIKAINGATVIFSAKKDIIIESSRGESATCSPVPEGQIQGILSADRDIVVEGNDGDCTAGPDKMLNIEGTLIANAVRGSGKFRNKRDICGGNLKWPTITIKARPDFILNIPGFMTEQNIVSHEETP